MAGERSESLDDDRRWQADLSDEIEDHLASEAETSRREGQTTDQARKSAMERFGPPSKVMARCLWIYKGDEIMNRLTRTALLSAIIILLLVAAVIGWQGQRTLATRLDNLTDQLISFTESQNRLAEAQLKLIREQSASLPATVSISGAAYMGSGDKPAEGYHVAIEGVHHEYRRSFRTDPQGRFKSGDLLPNAYRIWFHPCGESGEPVSAYVCKTSPFYLYRAGITQEVNLDVRQLVSQVNVHFNPSIPQQGEANELEKEWDFDLSLFTGEQKVGQLNASSIAIPAKAEDESFQLFIDGPRWPVSQIDSFPRRFEVPAGKLSIALEITIDTQSRNGREGQLQRTHGRYIHPRTILQSINVERGETIDIDLDWSKVMNAAEDQQRLFITQFGHDAITTTVRGHSSTAPNSDDTTDG